MEPNKNINQPKSGATSGTKKAGKKQGGAEASQSGGDGSHENGGDQDLLQQAKETTGEVVNQVQQRAGSQFNRQKETAANELSNVANAVRRFGESLSSEGNGPIARYAAEYGDKAAQSLDRLTNYIREQDPKQLLDDVQNFGRRQPVLLISGAFLLGFAGARLIKSSLDAGSQRSMNMGAQRSMNAGDVGSMNAGARSQSLNTNTAQQPPAPNTV